MECDEDTEFCCFMSHNVVCCHLLYLHILDFWHSIQQHYLSSNKHYFSYHSCTRVRTFIQRKGHMHGFKSMLLSIYLSIYSFVYISINLFIYLSVHLFTKLSIYYMFDFLYNSVRCSRFHYQANLQAIGTKVILKIENWNSLIIKSACSYPFNFSLS